MKKFKIYTTYKRLLADTTPPVSIYLRLRDIFPNSLLLESFDYHGREGNMSYICFDPIAGIKLTDDHLMRYFPDGSCQEQAAIGLDLKAQIQDFCNHLRKYNITHTWFISFQK